VSLCLLMPSVLSIGGFGELGYRPHSIHGSRFRALTGATA